MMHDLTHDEKFGKLRFAHIKSIGLQNKVCKDKQGTKHFCKWQHFPHSTNVGWCTTDVEQEL